MGSPSTLIAMPALLPNVSALACSDFFLLDLSLAAPLVIICLSTLSYTTDNVVPSEVGATDVRPVSLVRYIFVFFEIWEIGGDLLSMCGVIRARGALQVSRRG